MNIHDDLVGFLETSDFDDFTKIRYIYLYVCDLFSYDVRFMYGDRSLKSDIYNKKVDIKNAEDFEIACYTYAHVLVDLLALFNINAEIVRDSSYEFQHAYVVVKHKDKVLKLDPTIKHDTTRVKMHSPTLDFETLVDDPIFSDQLADADKHISSTVKKEVDYSVLYNNKTIMKLYDVLNESAARRKLTAEEAFFEKIQAIIGLVNTRFDFTRYDDIDYYFSYLLKKFRINENGVCVRPALFFKKDDPEMKDIINLVLIEYGNLPPIFYILEKVDNNYKFRSIELKEVEEKLDQYTNWNVEYYFRNKVEKELGKSI